MENFCYFQVPTIKNEQNMKEINTKEQKGRKRNKKEQKERMKEIQRKRLSVNEE